jgi:hypothetical protein
LRALKVELGDDVAMWLSTVLTETDSRSTIAVFERPAIVAAIDAERPRASTEPNTRALGEEQLDARLNGFASDLLRVPHDRRVPGTTANIDHLEVTPTGVFVIDAKKYTGHPRHKVEGGLLRPRVEKLVVGTRNCTTVVDGVLKQIEVVRGVVSETFPSTGCSAAGGGPFDRGQGSDPLEPVAKRRRRLRAERVAQTVDALLGPADTGPKRARRGVPWRGT